MNSPRKKRSTERANIACGHCKIIFSVKNYRKDIAKYCSIKCKGLAERVQVKVLCEICNKEFEHISSRVNKAKYCSRKCYYKAQHMKGTVTYKCHHCEKKFLGSPSHNRKFCSRSCNGKESIKTWKANFTTVRKNMLTRELIKKCCRCGFDSHISILGIHHIDRNRHNNQFSNLEVLCPNCHSIEHSKHISHVGFF